MRLIIFKKMVGLTDVQMVKFSKDLELPLEGVFLRDELPTNPKANAFYIFNLDTSIGDGTHWTCAITTDTDAVYFDSFGFPPPTEIVSFLKRRFTRVGWNSWVLQPIKSTTCGYWVLVFGTWVKQVPGPVATVANRFVLLFGSDFDTNDRAMKRMFTEAMY